MCENITENKEPEAFDLSKFEANKNYVIEASAGTGKTYSIVEIVGKLLNSGLKLENILIVTYTDKAAGELKDRIRKKCIEENIKNADVDNASIGTIHSFCRNIIKEFPVASGLSSEKELVDESAVKDFIKRYIRKGEIYNEICELKNLNPDKVKEADIVDTFKAYLQKYYINKYDETDIGIVSFDEKYSLEDY